jgi:hypothetical protein
MEASATIWLGSVASIKDLVDCRRLDLGDARGIARFQDGLSLCRVSSARRPVFECLGSWNSGDLRGFAS